MLSVYSPVSFELSHSLLFDKFKNKQFFRNLMAELCHGNCLKRAFAGLIKNFLSILRIVSRFLKKQTPS